MKLPKVTIGIVLHGGESYLKYSLPNLINQNYENLEIILRDQSVDGAVTDFIKKNLPEVANDKNVILQKGKNRMHSGGQNAIIQKMTGDYYICASYDMLYTTDFVTKVVTEMEKPENAIYGSATVKLLRWDFSKIATLGLEKSKTNFIDSCGIGALRSHYFFDIGQTKKDEGQFNQIKSVFGGSGALVVLRKRALEKISFVNAQGRTEFFDEILHYKNDVDLAYRLQWAGEKCLFIPDIKLWHDRQLTNKQDNSFVIVRILKNRKGKSAWEKENSFFGYLVIMKKNFSFGGEFSLKTKLKVLLHLSKMFVFVSIFEPSLWKAFRQYRERVSEILLKKDQMKKIISAGEIEKLMFCKL